jgi:hypothetical protein
MPGLVVKRNAVLAQTGMSYLQDTEAFIKGVSVEWKEVDLV